MDIGRWFSELPRDNGASEAPEEEETRASRAWDYDDDPIIGFEEVPEPDWVTAEQEVRQAPPGVMEARMERLEAERTERLARLEEARIKLDEDLARSAEADQECRTNVRSELSKLPDIPDGLRREEFGKRMNSRAFHLREAQQYLDDYDAIAKTADPVRAETLHRELQAEIDRRAAGTAEIIQNQELENDHQQRITDSRQPGFAERSVDQICSSIAEHVVREVAALAINHIAPGAGHAVVEIIFTTKKALSTISQLETGNALLISMPVALGNSGLSIDLSTKLPDGIPDNHAPRISAVMDFSPDGPPQTGDPDIELVDLPDPADVPSNACGNAEDEQVTEDEQLTETAKLELLPPERSAIPVPPGGVVVCKAAASAAAAAGTAVVDPAALLAMARREIRARFYRGTPRSVVTLMQALGALEVVVLVVPDLGCGLWVDIDPLTQSPAASLFFTMAPAEDGIRVAFFTQRKQPPRP